MASKTNNLEKIPFNSFQTNYIVLDDDKISDINYFNEISNKELDSPYSSSEEINEFFFNEDKTENINVLQVNISTLKQNFKNLHDFLNSTKFVFNIICVINIITNEKLKWMRTFLKSLLWLDTKSPKTKKWLQH